MFSFFPPFRSGLVGSACASLFYYYYYLFALRGRRRDAMAKGEAASRRRPLKTKSDGAPIGRTHTAIWRNWFSTRFTCLGKKVGRSPPLAMAPPRRWQRRVANDPPPDKPQRERKRGLAAEVAFDVVPLALQGLMLPPFFPQRPYDRRKILCAAIIKKNDGRRKDTFDRVFSPLCRPFFFHRDHIVPKGRNPRFYK